MGVFSSKAWDDMLEVTHPTTPAQRYRVIANDPRSPSEDIVRTPIQVEQTPKCAENEDATKDLSDKENHPQMLKAQSMPCNDPRSPSSNVVRTPIDGKENCHSYSKQQSPKKLFAEKIEGNQLTTSKNDSLRILVQKKEFQKEKKVL